jgi:hypothetical protein
MSRPTYVAESVTLVLNHAGTPTMNWIANDPNDITSDGKYVLAIRDRAFEDEREFEEWVAVFLWKNQKAYDRDTISAAAFILASLAKEAIRTTD